MLEKPEDCSEVSDGLCFFVRQIAATQRKFARTLVRGWREHFCFRWRRPVHAALSIKVGPSSDH